MKNKLKIFIISLILVFGSALMVYAEMPDNTMITGNVGLSLSCPQDSMVKIIKTLKDNEEFKIGTNSNVLIKTFGKWYDQNALEVDKTKIPKILYFDNNGNSKVYEEHDGNVVGEKAKTVEEEKKEKDDTKLETSIDIAAYLSKYYNEVETPLGKISFTYEVFENTFDFIEYDFWIQTKFGNSGIDKLKFTSKDYTQKQKDDAKTILKDFQEKLGRDVMTKMKDKKVKGGYFQSWYKYPYSKVGLEIRSYYSWQNYTDGSWSSNISKYEQAKPSEFRWNTIIDSQL